MVKKRKTYCILSLYPSDELDNSNISNSFCQLLLDSSANKPDIYIPKKVALCHLEAYTIYVYIYIYTHITFFCYTSASVLILPLLRALHSLVPTHSFFWYEHCKTGTKDNGQEPTYTTPNYKTSSFAKETWTTPSNKRDKVKWKRRDRECQGTISVSHPPPHNHTHIPFPPLTSHFPISLFFIYWNNRHPLLPSRISPPTRHLPKREEM